ncbi:KEOPS complex subunit Pcc1 [Roseibacillus persicicus]|uniref:Uncharacterized protein n=1 Tax=Roseibacillus persicicus TaxID=454148 RepID=A0A918WJM5_9BACT|nr:KEOPS complex subunit Pcc1 [Roseibacillus persicicus]MDQ8190446.1 KEOPS complex subunit Pcc1 [Roseibacillus persicicus]GHC48942.1 hypothetical protein GCM10007100_13620 [Roseibacillus persicicus]
MAEKSFLAVLTGDLIKSSSLSPDELDQVRELVLASVRELDSWAPSDSPVIVGSAEFFRGDSWQAALVQPQFGLRAALYLRAKLIHQGLSDSRVAIGLGSVDSIETTRISLSSGESFQLSGHALDNLSKQIDLTIAIAVEREAILSEWLPVVAQLCDGYLSRWTQRQAEVMTLLLHPDKPTHQEIANQLSVTRQTVTATVESAQGSALEVAVETFENSLTKLIEARP